MIHIIHVAILDGHSHYGTVIEIHLSHIRAAQIQSILEILLTMMYNIRYMTVNYAIIICNTINAINMIMDERDDQTVLAILSPALEGADGDAYVEAFIESLDPDTTTAELSIMIPEQDEHAHINDIFDTHPRDQHLLTVELQAATRLPWDSILAALVRPIEIH